MNQNVEIIPGLLHDAKLLHLDWQPSSRLIRLDFSCLLRNVDGSTNPKPIVELDLKAVERIAAYYAPTSPEVKPSEFRNESRLKEPELNEWRRDACEAFLSINSAHDDFRMTTSCELDWLFGGQQVTNDNGSRTGVHLKFHGGFGKNAVATGIYFECDSIEPRQFGAPLSIENWREQFEAWWKGWNDHWAEQDDGESDDEHERPQEDAFIPAGTSPPPDVAYQPPPKPAFQLEATDAPAELLQPISNFHSALLEFDWNRMAIAYPNFDESLSDRAEELRDTCLNHEFGRWVYVRQIDSWWVEGSRACVVVRGIEHVMPDEEDPATNEETVIAYGLLKSDQDWVISTWSQGWPQYGSALESSEQPEWRDGWRIGE